MSDFLCKTCGNTFGSQKKRAWTCQECKNKNREKAMSDFKKNNPTYWSNWNKTKGDLYGNSLKRLYGITREQVNAMRGEQKYACAISPRVEGSWNGNGGRLVVDHDHSTGVVRGLLCPYCNRALGQFSDDADVLRSAIEYLEAA